MLLPVVVMNTWSASAGGFDTGLLGEVLCYYWWFTAFVMLDHGLWPASVSIPYIGLSHDESDNIH